MNEMKLVSIPDADSPNFNSLLALPGKKLRRIRAISACYDHESIKQLIEYMGDHGAGNANLELIIVLDRRAGVDKGSKKLDKRYVESKPSSDDVPARRQLGRTITFPFPERACGRRPTRVSLSRSWTNTRRSGWHDHIRDVNGNRRTWGHALVCPRASRLGSRHRRR